MSGCSVSSTKMEKLINKYIELAVSHAECTMEGNSTKGNKVHSKMMKIIRLIKLESDEIRNLFYGTLEHENDSVKIWTAIILLRTKESESLSVLNKIAETNETIHGLTAESIIDCWKAGMLTDILNWNE